MKKKTVAPHVASVLSVAAAVISALHPGFSLPPNIASLATGLFIIIAGGLQFIAAWFHSNHAAKLAVIKALADKAVNDLKKAGVTDPPAQSAVATTTTP